MRRLAWAVLAGLASVAACASDRGAQGGEERSGSGADEGPRDSAQAELASATLSPVLLDCARLTYASTETPVEARLILDGGGAVAGLEVADLQGNPAALTCPGDRTGVERVLGGGAGQPWGRRPSQGWVVEAFCAPTFGGSGGCSVRTSAFADAAPQRGGSPPRKAGAATPTPVRSDLGRAPSLRRYQLRRLGADLPPGKSANLEQALILVDQAMALCLHSRQPDLNVSASSDFSARVTVSLDSKSISAPFRFEDMRPAPLWSFLTECVHNVAGDDPVTGMEVNVRYSVVAEVTETPPGRFVQQVGVEVMQEAVEVSAPARARKAMVDRIVSTMTDCLERFPVESRATAGRWANLGSVRFHGTVGTRVLDPLGVKELAASAAEADKPPPAILQTQVACTLSAIPRVVDDATPARASWLVVVKAGPLEVPR